MSEKKLNAEETGTILEKTYCVEWEQRNFVPIDTEKYSESIILFDHDDTLRNSLATMCQTDSAPVILIKPADRYRKINDNIYEINPDKKTDFLELLRELLHCNVKVGRIIYRWTKNMFSLQETQLIDQLENGFYALFYLSQAMMECRISNKIKLLYVFFAEEGMEPLQEAFSGFAKTIHLENPKYSYEVIRVDEKVKVTNSSVAKFLLSELENLQEDTQVYFDGNSKFVKCICDVNLFSDKQDNTVFRTGGTYLITGGTGGIGMIFARYLAREYKANLILTGSSSFNDTKKKLVDELNGLGANAKYIQADFCKRDEIEELLKQAKHYFSSINGVLHCAGAIKDALLINKKREDTKMVFGPKILGTSYLGELLAGTNLDFMVLFSGLASVIGNVGQIDYSFANAYLDHVCVYLNKKMPRTKVISINWPLWENGGMQIDSQLKEQLREINGMETIGDHFGVQVVKAALKNCYPQVIVVRINSNKKEVISFVMQEKRTEKSEHSNLGLNESGKTIKQQMEEYLKSVLSNELNIAVEKIKSSELWECYGIDSMSIVRMTNEMEKEFGELSKTLFFEYQNINELSDYFVENYAETIKNKLVKKETKPVEEKPVKKVQKKEIGKNRFSNTNKAPQKMVQKETKQTKQTVSDQDIAIIGVSGSYPEAENLDEYWENLKNGKDCITEIPSERWDYHKYYSKNRGEKGKMYAKWGGFLKNYDKFDPMFFGITPRDAEVMDPQERLFLSTSFHAFEDAGYNISELKEHEVGVFVGVMYGHYELFAAEETERGNTMALSSSFSSIANRVSYTFDLTGPCLAVDTMCSSSLTTIHLACQSIRSGECDMAVAGGVNLSIHPNKYLYLSANNFASSDGKCRSFGDGGDGYVPGEGVGAVILKSVEQAKKDNDHIYAVIKASTINHGGKANGYTVPNPNKQADLIVKALKKADISPRAISYVEAHGTGTSLGDPIEVTGLNKAYEQFTKDKQYCAIGSVKSNIGHLESAAGIAGITKIILQMQHKQLVPSIHSDELNKNIRFENTPFKVQRTLTNWERPVVERKGRKVTLPRIAAISAFGAGGSNAHVILEEYIDKNPVQNVTNNKQQIVVLSARSEVRLKEFAKELQQYLEKDTIGRNTGVNKAENGKKIVHEKLMELAASFLQVSIQELDADITFEDMNFNLVELSSYADSINNMWNLDLSVQTVIECATVSRLGEYILNHYDIEVDNNKNGAQKDSVSDDVKLEQIAYTLQVGREEKDQRVAFIVSSMEELKDAVRNYINDRVTPNTFVGKVNSGSEKSEEVLDEKLLREWIENEDMEQLAKNWIEGMKINWNLLYSYQKPQRISLPGYPFESKRYWYNSFQKANKVEKTVEPKVESKPVERVVEPEVETQPVEEDLYAGYEEEIKKYHGDEVSLQIVHDTIAIISMHDEKHRNMFYSDLVIGLMAKFKEVQQNKNIKAIILTGYDNIFCMGGTQEQLLEISDEERSFTDVPFLYKGLLECEIPVIAAIQGHASGGGLLFGLYSDMVVMANEGIYSAVFMKYGFTPGMGATYILKKRFGENLATEMMYTAKSFSGEELARRGAPVIIKNRDEVLKEALRIAESLSEKSRLALTTLKQDLSGRMLEQLPMYIERESLMHKKTFTTIEVKERIKHYYLDEHEFGEMHENVKEDEIDLDDMLDAISSGKMSPSEAKAFRFKNIEVD